MKSRNCVVILAILNTMIQRVVSSVSEIDAATRGLGFEQASTGTIADIDHSRGSREE